MEKKRLEAIDSYFRITNYLSAIQIYLKKNALLNRPLHIDDIKPRLLGHWGTTPGLNFIYAHLNRLIQDTHSEWLFVPGPGHGGPAVRANVFLEGILSEIHPEYSLDANGIDFFAREFSWPGGAPSHAGAQIPGTIQEGGELGYCLAHSFGAVFDHPELLVACVVGDGEAETGPLAASWQSNKFLHPQRDGAVLPILHLNGYKISGPTVFGRMKDQELIDYFAGSQYKPYFVEGHDPMQMHRKMWKALDMAYKKIRKIQSEPLRNKVPVWPLIILRSSKGWTGPKTVDGKKIEGTCRSHQVPLTDIQKNPEHLYLLEKWLQSYKPQDLFDEMGRPRREILNCLPKKERQMGRSPYANGGLLLKELKLPPFKNYALNVSEPGSVIGEATKELGKFLRDLIKLNKNQFRLFCPDETSSNRLDAVFEVTGRMYLGKIYESDEGLSHEGRVMEVLSEHLCQGWLEGYLITGRHGLFPCYEAFAMIIDSMLNQFAKWLKICNELPWRKPIASLNYLLTSHAWRQDHNGYSHQGPGFIESVLQKKADIARIYFPPDTNCLLSIGNHCLASQNHINLMIIGKQPMPQWLNIKDADEHCKKGISSWKWASNDGGKPDLILASAGDIPTLEILAAISYLKEEFPKLKMRMVNVVDLFTLVPSTDHSHGLTEEEFENIFTKTLPVIFAFHGHPRVIHELIYKRNQSQRFHVHGYIEEGTTTTPFDMVVCNRMSRFDLAMNAVSRLPHLGIKGEAFIERCKEKLLYHQKYISSHGEDIPEVLNWKWGNHRHIKEKTA